MYSFIMPFITLPFCTPLLDIIKLTYCDRTEATIDSSGKKDKILLKIRVEPTALKGADVDSLKETLKNIGKQKGKKKDVKVKAEILPLL